jgi:hypothetical protein
VGEFSAGTGALIMGKKKMSKPTYYVIAVAPETEHNLITNLIDPLATVLPEHIQVQKIDTLELPKGIVDGLKSDTTYLARVWPYDEFGVGLPTPIKTFRTLKRTD